MSLASCTARCGLGGNGPFMIDLTLCDRRSSRRRRAPRHRPRSAARSAGTRHPSGRGSRHAAIRGRPVLPGRVAPAPGRRSAPSMEPCLPVRRTTTWSTRAPRRSPSRRSRPPRTSSSRTPAAGSSAPWSGARRTSSTSRTGSGRCAPTRWAPASGSTAARWCWCGRSRTRPSGPQRSASGSTYVVGARARVAREGRIYVEGKHDAELVEKVWGHDLRIEGVVVEPLHGVDDLPGIVREFRPVGGTAARRARRPPGDRLEGDPHRRAGDRRPRPGRRPPVHRHLAGGQALGGRDRGVADRAQGRGLEDRRLQAAGLGGRHRLRVGAADPGPGAGLDRPRADPHRPGRGADRLRHEH